MNDYFYIITLVLFYYVTILTYYDETVVASFVPRLRHNVWLPKIF